MRAAAPAVSASGSLWQYVPSPNPSTVSVSNDVLEGVSALADNNVWAVGNDSSSVGNNVKHTLVEHWNGTAWSVVPSPNVGTQGSELLGVVAISSTDAWAVGDFSTSATVNRPPSLAPSFAAWP
jgi:hypothetical protein